MKTTIKTYKVKVIRESGENPITGQLVPYDEQSFDVDAINVHSAYSISIMICTLQFTGQLRRTFINEEEYFNIRY